VRRVSTIVEHQIMNTTFNLTALMPNTNYMFEVASVRTESCSGIPKIINVTTSTREAGVPRSELALLHTLLSTKFLYRGGLTLHIFLYVIVKPHHKQNIIDITQG